MSAPRPLAYGQLMDRQTDTARVIRTMANPYLDLAIKREPEDDDDDDVVILETKMGGDPMAGSKHELSQSSLPPRKRKYAVS